MVTLSQHVRSTSKFLPIALIRNADNETELPWNVLIFKWYKSYFLPYKYTSLQHNQTICRSSSDNQVKHMHNKIVALEWLTEQRVIVLHCACTRITPVQYKNTLTPDKVVRDSRNLVYKLKPEDQRSYNTHLTARLGWERNVVLFHNFKHVYSPRAWAYNHLFPSFCTRSRTTIFTCIKHQTRGRQPPGDKSFMSTRSPYHFAYLLQVSKKSLWSLILYIQATLFISKSRGPDKILRVISSLR